MQVGQSVYISNPVPRPPEPGVVIGLQVCARMATTAADTCALPVRSASSAAFHCEQTIVGIAAAAANVVVIVVSVFVVSIIKHTLQ
jgi:hypothetical protein